MGAQPEMNQKQLARMQKGAQPMLEPGETVLYGAFNLTAPMWVYGASVGILILPYMAQKYSLALVTQRNVYVLRTTLLGKAKRIMLKASLGSVEAHVGGSSFPGRYLMVGDQKIWLHFRRTATDPARALAAAASGQAATEQPATGAAPPEPAAPPEMGDEQELQQPPT